MKLTLFILAILIFFSCNKNYYGTYNTRYSKDKSVFFEIKLNHDNTVEKTEIHTIYDSAKGTVLIKNKQIICMFDSSTSGFPPDTKIFIKRGKKLYFKSSGGVNKKTFLLKQ